MRFNMEIFYEVQNIKFLKKIKNVQHKFTSSLLIVTSEQSLLSRVQYKALLSIVCDIEKIF